MPGLRRARTARGLSLRELDMISGVQFTTISRLERGLTSAQKDTVELLARALKVRPKELMKEDDEQEEELLAS